MRTAEISAVVDEALELAYGRGASEADAAARARACASRNPEFAEKYPKLLEMCCASVTADAQDSVRHFLPLMLGELTRAKRSARDGSGGGGADPLHSASVSVGQALADRYLPPPAAAPTNGNGEAAKFCTDP